METNHTFKTTLHEQDAILRDHRLFDDAVLPGTAYLEMARAAALNSLRHGVGGLANVVWRSPVVVGATPREIRIDIDEGGERARFAVRGESGEAGAAGILHCDGEILGREALPGLGQAAPRLDLAALARRCRPAWRGDAFYAFFARHEMRYGPSFRCIEQLSRGDTEVFATYRLPATEHAEAAAFDLHPGILDGALQATLGLLLDDLDSSVEASYLPYSVREVIVHARTPETGCIVARWSDPLAHGEEMLKFDIDLTDESGAVCVSLREFASRRIAREASAELLFGTTDWLDSPLPAPAPGEAPWADTLLAVANLSAELDARLRALAPSAISLEALVDDAGELRGERLAEPVIALLDALRAMPNGKRARAVMVVLGDDARAWPYASLSAVLKTLRQEYSGLRARILRLAPTLSAQAACEAVAAELREPEDRDVEVRYDARGHRGARRFVELALPAPRVPRSCFRSGGVYWITGGMGGLGRLFAEHAAATRGVTLVLSARTAASAEDEAWLTRLRASGANLEHRRVDLTDAGALRACYEAIVSRHGHLDGIIHAAGVLRDGYVESKTADAVRDVFAAKAAALVELDAITADAPLDFFVLFASIAGIWGNAGQADYAGANALLDAFAIERNRLVAEGRRAGRTLSIDWPLWRTGGMNVDAASERRTRRAYGLAMLERQAGMLGFERAMAAPRDHVVVLCGDAERIRGWVAGPAQAKPVAGAAPAAAGVPAPAPIADAAELGARVDAALARAVCEILRIGESDVDAETDFSAYGFDSISLTEFSNRIGERLGVELLPTIFYEYPSLLALRGFLLAEHGAALAAALQVQPAARRQVEPDPDPLRESNRESNPGAAAVGLPEGVAAAVATPGPAPRSASTSAPTPLALDAMPAGAVAIVGFSGRFPRARSLDAFWTNLLEQRDCIDEIPAERWDWRAIHGDPHEPGNRTTIRWGGFIDEIAAFDSQFFGISPREAELMDPQQRLLMEHVWAAMEDAGYSAKSIAGSRTGVFLAIGPGGYRQSASQPIESYSATGAVPSMAPNRISFLLNLHGPSEPVETACSSSLVAVHRAMRAIEAGDCEQAFVGGVNTIVSPELHICFSKAGMLSPDGRCKTFSREANGYVRGEGVGAMLLRPLGRAIADGDTIHGVIRAVSVNHGGRAASLTAPNVQAQAALLTDAYRRANLDIRTVSYVEAHGTGTSLGDPAEINGLKRAFATLYEQQQARVERVHCALGSVKSSIGHLEVAAGMAGLFKVLLAMRHGVLPGTLHCEDTNPYIELEGTPFEILKQNRAWTRLSDARGAPVPRRAGISSFGFGGVNAHLVVEEYLDARPGADAAAGDRAAPLPVQTVVPLSARSAASLRDYALALLAFVEGAGTARPALRELAWTLQVGRDAMAYRVAFVVASLDELAERLRRFLDGETRFDGIHVAEAAGERDGIRLLNGDDDARTMIASWIAQRKWSSLARAWAAGLEVDWRMAVPPGALPRRIQAPTYPFARELHWVARDDAAVVEAVAMPLLEYEPAWLPAPDAAADAARAPERDAEPVRLLHFAESAGASHALEGALREHGAPVELIRVTRGALNGRLGRRHFEVAAMDEATLRDLLAACDAGTSAQGAVDIVYGWRGDPSSLAELHALLRAARAEAVALRRLVVLGSWDEAQAQGCGDQAAIGLVRSLRLSMPQLRASVLFGEGGLPDAESVVRSWRETSGADVLRERAGRRETLGWRAVEPAPAAADLRERGVYLITGGAGGLGRLFARHLARRCHARLALVGRRVRDGEIDALLDELRAHGATDAAYFPAEVADEDALRGVVETIRTRWGGLHGVLHAAGVATRGTLEDRRPEDVEAVVSPKVAGTQALDAATADEALDFFCCFSSSSAVLGDSGAGDYAGANAYQLAYAAYRNARVEAGERSGRTVSVAWPLWREGGMGAQEGEAIEQYLRSSAQRYLEREEGLAAWERALASGAAQRLVLAGDRARIEGFLARLGATRQDEQAGSISTGFHDEEDETMSAPLQDAADHDATDAFQRWLHAGIRAGVESLLKLSGERLRDTANFADLGFDSIGLAHFGRWLSRRFGIDVTPDLFFDHSTIVALVAHLSAASREALIERWRADTRGAAVPPTAARADLARPASTSRARTARPANAFAANRSEATRPDQGGVAIIGVSVRTAGANDAGELWELLRSGRRAIGEVPASRWDWRPYFNGPGEASNRIATHRGAFIEGLDGFDPLFFEISPREAQWMDPRQRLILEEAWRAFEDAGYAGERLRGSRCGVFIGVEEGVPGEAADGLATSHHNGILAARISYVLDLKGPNLAINTACSSGLVAVHTACQSVQRGECELALAGGVNVLNSPLTYVALTQGGMLSSSGECHAFDARADGMV
ncbi:SDR family NAD(P)-dependent oxidoreductase, partial [Burkholderia gladioli]|uniref:SDR family NAD(P)-dependent oxidoreductase n=2 Tax=Burkholderia gladioli TaxID=28095 RepID=UPI00301B504D